MADSLKIVHTREENTIMDSLAQPTISLSGGEYVVCMCEGKHRVGVVMLVDDKKEAKIQFMHPPLPTTSLSDLAFTNCGVQCAVALDYDEAKSTYINNFKWPHLQCNIR